MHTLTYLNRWWTTVCTTAPAILASSANTANSIDHATFMFARTTERVYIPWVPTSATVVQDSQVPMIIKFLLIPHVSFWTSESRTTNFLCLIFGHQASRFFRSVVYLTNTWCSKHVDVGWVAHICLFKIVSTEFIQRTHSINYRGKDFELCTNRRQTFRVYKSKSSIPCIQTYAYLACCAQLIHGWGAQLTTAVVVIVVVIVVVVITLSPSLFVVVVIKKKRCCRPLTWSFGKQSVACAEIL